MTSFIAIECARVERCDESRSIVARFASSRSHCLAIITARLRPQYEGTLLSCPRMFYRCTVAALYLRVTETVDVRVRAITVTTFVSRPGAGVCAASGTVRHRRGRLADVVGAQHAVRVSHSPFPQPQRTPTRWGIAQHICVSVTLPCHVHVTCARNRLRDFSGRQSLSRASSELRWCVRSEKCSHLRLCAELRIGRSSPLTQKTAK